ncbi:MAG: DUF5655 domain-containing protein [Pseudomonadota bacterium]
MPATPDKQLATMLANMQEKTGKSLEQWLKLLGKQTFEKHGEIVKHLKAEHAVTHGFANLIAHQALNPSGANDDLIQAQYAGAKAPLRPILDAILEHVQGFGGDVEVAPKKTSVSLRRSKQFALVQPSTKTRVDVGINLKGVAAEGRLEASGSFSAMVSHRVRLGDVSEVDAELVGWLHDAYERA